MLPGAAAGIPPVVNAPHDTVEYDDPSHTYRVNGVVFPSVSQVIAFFCDFSRVKPDVLERKRQIGRATHKCIELHADGALDLDSIDPAVQPYFDSWLKFIATKPVLIVDAEKIVYSKTHRVAGRLDLVGVMDDTLWLLDAKCVDKMSPETALQTAAYAELYRETTGTKIAKRGGLQLQPDGSCARLFPYENRSDWMVFLNARNLYTWINNHRKAA
jgi:hypothetical protein